MNRLFLRSLVPSLVLLLVLANEADPRMWPANPSQTTDPELSTNTPDKRHRPRSASSSRVQDPPDSLLPVQTSAYPESSLAGGIDAGKAASELPVDRNVEAPGFSAPSVPAIACATPMSLMLHSAFGEERMEALAQAILEHGWQTMTYRDLLPLSQAGECPPERAVIVSIDDLGTDWLRPDFKRMIQAFNEYGLVVVVGVVVHGPQDESIWAYLSQLEALGNEVASHSVDHLNLPLLDAEGLAGQVDGSYDTICLNLGKCPVTLILPFGNIDPEGRILAAANAYSFVVGIPGGHRFAGMPPYYLGRIPPVNESQDQTLASLEASFRHEAGELLAAVEGDD